MNRPNGRRLTVEKARSLSTTLEKDHVTFCQMQVAALLHIETIRLFPRELDLPPVRSFGDDGIGIGTRNPQAGPFRRQL